MRVGTSTTDAEASAAGHDPAAGTAHGLDEMIARTDRKRAESRVSYDPRLRAWHVLGHAEVKRVLTDTSTYSSDLADVMPEESHMQGNFLRMDPPDHRRYRTLVAHAFLPRVVAGLQGRMRTTADQHVADLPSDESVDVIALLARPYPLTVISELLGVPSADGPLFARWGRDLFAGNMSYDSDKIDTMRSSAIAMHGYLVEHVRVARRTSAPSGLLADVARTVVDGERLTDAECATFGALVLIAGHVTTTAALGGAVLHLAADTAVLAAIRQDTADVTGIVDELLRLRPPFVVVPRITTRDTELAGVAIPARSVVIPSLFAANRDARVHRDPHRFDPARGTSALAFGHGVHHCFGAALARAELTHGLRALAGRFARIDLDPHHPPVPYDAPGLLGIGSLHAVLVEG